MTKRPAKDKQPNAATPNDLGFSGTVPYELKKGEEYMNTTQLAHFRSLLSEWKQQLMEDFENTVNHMKEDSSPFPDPIDRASQDEGIYLDLRTSDRKRKLLRKIEQALDKIDKGDYGFCDDCGAEIGLRRLEARPTAVKCIDCKTFEEIKERQVTEE